MRSGRPPIFRNTAHRSTDSGQQAAPSRRPAVTGISFTIDTYQDPSLALSILMEDGKSDI